MRSVVNSTFVTLDGVINHMERWHFSAIDEDSDALAAEQLKASDALLLGRRTYEIYAATWPTRSGVHADLINAMPKYVASNTLTSPECAGTTVIDRDLAGRVGSVRRTV
jgi:dihydrofolate reductase